jgi:hypothetical protein
MLTRIGADIYKRSPVCVRGAHYIAEQKENRPFVSAVVKNVIIDTIAEIAPVSNAINVRDKIEALAAIARGDRSSLFPTKVGAAQAIVVGEIKIERDDQRGGESGESESESFHGITSAPLSNYFSRLSECWHSLIIDYNFRWPELRSDLWFVSGIRRKKTARVEDLSEKCFFPFLSDTQPRRIVLSCRSAVFR